MDTKTMAHLQRVQRKGWVVESATSDGCIATCPNIGCSMRARLQTDRLIPDMTEPHQGRGVEIASYDQLRSALKDRRHELRLSLSELDDATGLTVDHIAKSEQDPPTRTMNLDLLLIWANALGFKLTLERTGLPPITLRKVAETRDRVDARAQRIISDREKPRRTARR